jgi:hypothetical protein
LRLALEVLAVRSAPSSAWINWIYGPGSCSGGRPGPGRTGSPDDHDDAAVGAQHPRRAEPVTVAVLSGHPVGEVAHGRKKDRDKKVKDAAKH